MTIDQRLYANSAKTTLSSPLNISDTSIIVADASKFPIPSTSGQYFLVTIDSGSTFEIVKVTGISGNVLTGVTRGQEGTVPQSFSTGTRVENRATRDTFASFARLIDRVADIASVDNLPTVANTTANSYLCASLDDSSNPILAIKRSSYWRFANHPTVAASGTASAGTTTSMVFTSASSVLPVTTPGSHIIQFTSGANSGLCRIIQSVDSSNLYWSTALPNAVASGDAYEVYQSSSFSFTSLNASKDDALIFSILFGE